MKIDLGDFGLQWRDAREMGRGEEKRREKRKKKRVRDEIRMEEKSRACEPHKLNRQKKNGIYDDSVIIKHQVRWYWL